jgi:hypothetical protein
MPRGRKIAAEQIIAKLREAEVELARGKKVPETARLPQELDEMPDGFQRIVLGELQLTAGNAEHAEKSIRSGLETGDPFC